MYILKIRFKNQEADLILAGQVYYAALPTIIDYTVNFGMDRLNLLIPYPRPLPSLKAVAQPFSNDVYSLNIRHCKTSSMFFDI